ncbi:hypothetical protein diail_5300 [Diaporthe ilicicola]|nr:hypothetical protein diail_5300 [Diaporthe ilicicola]
MLDTIMLYWLSNSGTSSARYYWECEPDSTAWPVDIPVGVSWFGGDNSYAPREWCERYYKNIVHWNETERGGHFAAWEVPDVFVAEPIPKIMFQISILVVTGSFSLPEFYDAVINAVSSKGHEIRALHLRSAGLASGKGRPGPHKPTMVDGAAMIASEVEALADAGKAVILIAHSYGGVPATESTLGLRVEERARAGKAGGVARLAYLTAIVPEVGMSAGEVLSGVLPENRDELTVNEDGWMFHAEAIIAAAARHSFSDLPQAEGEAWIRRFPRHSAASFAGPLTHAGYAGVPVSYLLCEGDVTIPAENQRAGIEVVERASGRAVDVTSIGSGHYPMASQPDAVVDWILDLVKKTQVSLQ